MSAPTAAIAGLVSQSRSRDLTDSRIRDEEDRAEQPEEPPVDPW